MWYNGRRLSFYAFGFSWAENLSAQYMGYLGATLTQMFAHAGGADASLSDVTIAQMGNGASKCEWRHAPEGILKKSVELRPASGEDGWLSLARGGLRLVSHEMCGGRWRSQNRKNVYLSPYIEEPLNSKLIKCFVPELRSRECFSCFEIPMFYVYIVWTLYIHFAYPYHGYGTSNPEVKDIVR